MALGTQREAGLAPVVTMVVTLVVTTVGALGSLGFLLHAAGPGVSYVLILVMTLWTLAPFAGLEAARRLSMRSSKLLRGMNPSAIYALEFVVATGSLIGYSVDAVRPFRSRAAFPFVVIPMISWALLAVAIVMGRLLQNRTRSGIARL